MEKKNFNYNNHILINISAIDLLKLITELLCNTSKKINDMYWRLPIMKTVIIFNKKSAIPVEIKINKFMS